MAGILQSQLIRSGAGAKVVLTLEIEALPPSLDVVSGWSLDWSDWNEAAGRLHVCYSRANFDPTTESPNGLVERVAAEVLSSFAG